MKLLISILFIVLIDDCLCNVINNKLTDQCDSFDGWEESTEQQIKFYKCGENFYNITEISMIQKKTGRHEDAVSMFLHQLCPNKNNALHCFQISANIMRKCATKNLMTKIDIVSDAFTAVIEFICRENYQHVLDFASDYSKCKPFDKSELMLCLLPLVSRFTGSGDFSVENCPLLTDTQSCFVEILDHNCENGTSGFFYELVEEVRNGTICRNAV